MGPDPLGGDVPRSFALTYDYRCPFARIAAEHVITGLRAGAPWNVWWIPFSLSQVHVEEGAPPVWERPEIDSGLLALEVAAAVQELVPDRFIDVHRDLFDVRHVHSQSLRDPDVLGALLARHDVDPEKVWEHVADGGPRRAVQDAHEGVVTRHRVWGVPTFIMGEQASFVRLMRPSADADEAIRSIDRILDLLEGWPELNEFKHTAIAR
jgi:2-hydroxychromene-2-carboxylate isomerase